jgi:hypothetical protein
MNENPWSSLAEFTHTCASDGVEQTSGALKTAVQDISLPEIFIQRLSICFAETIDKHLQRADVHPVMSTVKVRVFLNNAGPNAQESASIWGFFFIETDQMIELYLYQDQA